jgi:C4-dicarboxylate-specific signal transduction histidine kinase
MIDKPRKGDNGLGLPLQEYFDALPGIVSVQDRNLRIVHTNSRLREFFGDPGGMPCYTFFKRRKDECPGCPVVETFRTGERSKNESVVIKQNGEELPVMVYTSPIKNDAGEVVHVIELAADISDVKRLQKRLFRTQQRLQQFFDEVPCYVSVQDRDLKLVAANRRFKEDFGDDIGGHCYEIYKHRSEPCLVCPVERTFEDGQSTQSEEVVTSMSGEQYNVLVHLESTGLLISSISHSIKGLLTGLDGGMYLVDSGLNKDNPDRLKKGWEMVTRNVDRIRSTVLDILYYAKEREPEWKDMSAKELIDEVYSVTKPKADQHGIDLQLNVDGDAGELVGDPMALRSMLVNLMENAVDACRVDKKKTDHTVTLSAFGDEEWVRFEISDNGIGMDRETREKVFSLFFSSKGTEGTGLGLFIANVVAKGHGGGVEVDSEVDKGTRFTVTLARVRPAEEPGAHSG